MIGNEYIDQSINKTPYEAAPCVSELTPCVPVSAPKLATDAPKATPKVIHCDDDLMGNADLPSIQVNGITIYQSCIDGLLPQRMINDNIVSLLME